MSAVEILEQIRRLSDQERREVTNAILEEFGQPDKDLPAEQVEIAEPRHGRREHKPERWVPEKETCGARGTLPDCRD
jgi:hypothetical protein